MIAKVYLSMGSVIKVIALLTIIFHPLVTGVPENKKNSSNIFALIWTTPEVRPFPSRNVDQYFAVKKCKYQNCFVTDDKTYFTDIKWFDYVLFSCLDITSSGVPPERSVRQKYIFVSEEPVHYCSLSSDYNGFFNLTWTFKLDSDATLKYYKVKNKKGKVIGPKRDMHWIDEMRPTSKYIKRKLESKSKAATWFVSNCFTPGLRENYVKVLQNELHRYQLNLDQFGICAEPKCHKNAMDECYAMLETDYYFYLAFENSFHEDYVTEKVLTAVNHFSVPIVYGGANYTRFLPRGSYLNAMILGPEGVAEAINEAIKNKEKYYEYYKFHRHYTFHDPKEDKETDEICAFCEFLNKDRKLNRMSVYTNFKNFWK